MPAPTAPAASWRSEWRWLAALLGGAGWIFRDRLGLFQEKVVEPVWLEASGLPEEVREKIRNPGQERNVDWRSRFIESGSQGGITIERRRIQ